VRSAECKIRALLFCVVDTELDITEILKHGADTAMDRLIHAIGAKSYYRGIR